jgi:hypothetical protein
MKSFACALVAVLLLASVAMAAGIDGKWFSERKISRDGQEMTIKTTLDLKSAGDKLTGTLKVNFGEMEIPPMEIADGKIDGNKFTFTTTMSGPNGDMKMSYEGTVDGDAMKGTITREGGQPRPFEAKRQ